MRVPTRYGQCESCGFTAWLYNWKTKLYNDQGHKIATVHHWWCWHCLPTRWK